MKILSCDVCDKNYPIEAEAEFFALTVPAGVLGDVAYTFDICSLACLSNTVDGLDDAMSSSTDEEPSVLDVLDDIPKKKGRFAPAIPQTEDVDLPPAQVLGEVTIR